MEITPETMAAAQAVVHEPAVPKDASLRGLPAGQAAEAQAAPVPVESAAANALRFAGLRVTPENAALVEALLLHNFPADKETLLTLNRALKLMGGDMQKALFFLQNDMQPTTVNAAQLNAFANGEAKLSAQLTVLMNELAAMPEGDVKNELLRLLTNADVPNASPGARMYETFFAAKPAAGRAAVPGNVNMTAPTAARAETAAAALRDVLPQRLPALVQAFADAAAIGAAPTEERAEAIVRQVLGEIIPAQSESLPEGFVRAAVRFVTEQAAVALPARERALWLAAVAPEGRAAHKFVFSHRDGAAADIDVFLNELRESTSAARVVAARSGTAGEPVMQAIDAAETSVQFMQDMKSAVFMQLPIALNGWETTAELYVFRDKRKKQAKGGTATALLALEPEHLGRVEAYIRRDGQTVSCQFRLERPDAEALVRAHATELGAAMAAAGYRLETVMYHALGEPYSLLQEEPVDERPKAVLPARVDQKV